ncbi:hypothetical protein IWW50_002313, partial [Coemansia erecta]
MFTSPSVRVRRRQPAKQLGAETSTSDLTAPKQILKRSINTSITQNGGLRNAAALSANTTAPVQQPSHESIDTLHLQPSPNKKQATEANRPVWLAPLSQQINRPQPTEASQEAEEMSSSWQMLDNEDKMGFGGAPSSAIPKRAESAAGNAELAHSTEIEAPQDTGHVLLRGDKHAVFDVAAFPDTVQRQLGSIDFESVPVASGLSSASSFAFVATPTTCLVWSYDSTSSAMGGVYRLAMPDPDDAADFEAPLVALVSVGDVQSDVGVLACSATGQLRYWDRVAFGLGGTDRFYNKELELLDAADRCVQITEAFAGLFVVATAKGYLFQVSLQDAQGTTELSAHCLSRSAGTRTGMLSRMSSLLGGSQFAPAAVDASDALVGVAGGVRTEIRHSRELFVLTRQRLAKWVISRTHPEKFMFSMDILQALAHAAARRFDMDVEVGVYDIATTRSGDVCVLAGLQSPQLGGRVQLAIGVLRGSRVSTEPDVVGLWPLDYAPDVELSQTGPECPRLVLPEGGPGMFVVLRKAVVASVLPTSG